MKELLTPFIIGIIASLIAGGLVFLVTRFWLRYQKEWLLHRKELEMQKELLTRQQEHSKILRDKKTDLDKRILDATDQLLARANKAYEAGIYDAALIIAAAALESRLRSVSSPEYKDRPLRQLVQSLIQTQALEPDIGSEVIHLWDKRNRLIHSMADVEISKQEARAYLDNTDKILLELSFKTP